MEKKSQFRKIILLIIAVTVHNIPEGLAVGVGFGAVGKTKKATFHNARFRFFGRFFFNGLIKISNRFSRNLAIGIGIQNFPEVNYIERLLVLSVKINR